ncbi:MAG: D-aminoacyl-tRNA deacylase [Bacilli bacterium]
MKVVLQRSKQASVTIEGDVVGSIERGLVLLVGITHDDTEKEVKWMADKIAGLRIFEDAEGRMNVSVSDVGGAILSISQFTLFADCKKGKRPSFTAAARPELAEGLYNQFNEEVRKHGLDVQTGVFGADMQVQLINDGPVTIVLDTNAL